MNQQYPEGFIPEQCPMLREKYGERLASIEAELKSMRLEIGRTRIDKYIWSVIFSSMSGTITYLLMK